MIKIYSVIIMLCSFKTAFAQKDLIERVEKQAVEIDSLKKLVKADMDSGQLIKKENNSLLDSIKKLNSDLTLLEEFRKGKKNLDSMIRYKTDSIVLLKANIEYRDNQITIEKQEAEQKAKEENEKGKYEILSIIVNRYKSKSFDELLKSSTKQSVLQDLLLCQSLPEIQLILSDIQKYSNAKELLDAKLDAAQINIQQIQLGQIKHESVVITKLKELLSNYQTINDGLKETLERIIALDKREAVFGMSKEIQKKKFDKILADLSSFIFNYDFSFSDYPYLSDIILELIKRKQPNADAEISDLLKEV